MVAVRLDAVDLDLGTADTDPHPLSNLDRHLSASAKPAEAPSVEPAASEKPVAAAVVLRHRTVHTERRSVSKNRGVVWDLADSDSRQHRNEVTVGPFCLEVVANNPVAVGVLAVAAVAAAAVAAQIEACSSDKPMDPLDQREALATDLGRSLKVA